LLVLLFCVSGLAACSSYGTKVTFEGNKGEVYYKGDSVTESDAKAVGKFLEDESYFQNDDRGRSVQISRENGHIKARFVLDEKVIDSMADADKNFALIGAAMSKDVFNNTPVDVIYADEYFKDFKTVPYDPTQLPAIRIADEIKHMDNKKYGKNILYYSHDIAGAKADSISDYLVKNGFFLQDGDIALLISSLDSGGYRIEFPIKSSSNTAQGLQDVDNFGKAMKRDLFSDVPVKLDVLADNMATVKTFTY